MVNIQSKCLCNVAGTKILPPLLAAQYSWMIFNPLSTALGPSLETGPGRLGPTRGKHGGERSGVADAETRVSEGVDGVVTFNSKATELQVFNHQSY